ncbi:hypothetical protein LguiB_033693 [Lonicera macranthoides]
MALDHLHITPSTCLPCLIYIKEVFTSLNNQEQPNDNQVVQHSSNKIVCNQEKKRATEHT